MDKPTSNPVIDFSTINKILIVRLGKIGDIVVTSFIFELLKRAFPSIEIHLLTYESNRGVLKYNPNLDSIIYAKKNISLYLKMFGLVSTRYDLIMDFNDNPSTTTALIFKFGRAGIKAGYNFGKYEKVINFRVSPLAKIDSHIIDRMKNFLIQLGIKAEEKFVKPFFYIGSTELDEVESELLEIRKNKRLVAVNLSAGAEIRYWSIEKWSALLSQAEEKYRNLYFILLSLKKDEYLKSELASRLGLEKCHIGRYTSIQHFAAYIKSSDLIITPDTSSVHIASAFGVPTLALYPNPEWNYVSWQPYNVPHRSIKSPSEDINEIPVQEVFIKFESLINEIGLN